MAAHEEEGWATEVQCLSLIVPTSGPLECPSAGCKVLGAEQLLLFWLDIRAGGLVSVSSGKNS